jgi:hypothetical protein
LGWNKSKVFTQQDIWFFSENNGSGLPGNKRIKCKPNYVKSMTLFPYLNILDINLVWDIEIVLINDK